MISTPLLFSIVFSSICIVSLYLGIFTLYTNPKTKTNRLFFALTVALSIWSFGFAMAISAPDISACLFWRRFSAIGWGVFYSILLNFMIALSGRASLLNKWWKYVLLYFPAAVCILLFTYVPGLNPYQYKLVQTEMGWVNVSIKNYWDWFFILYYLSYSLLGIYYVWKWGKSESSRNIKKQSGIIVRVFIITFILGAFSESVANNIFPFKIPQIAPIIMILPVLAIGYAMQKYGFLDGRRYMANSILFGDQIRMRIIHYLASTLIAASIVNIILMHFIFENTGLVPTFLFSAFLILTAVFFEMVERLSKSTRSKDFIYAAAFFVLIPVLTLNFVKYASVTVWSLAFILLIISIAMVSRIIQIAAAASILLTQLMVFLLNPSVVVNVNAMDHVGRISLGAIAVWIALFVMNVFRSKLLENAYQISFQTLVADISTHYISVDEQGFDKVTYETLRRTSEFLESEGTFIYLLSGDKSTITCSHSWTNELPSEVNGREVKLRDYPRLRRLFLASNNLEIFDIDDLSSDEYEEIVKLLGGQVKSLLILPIENNNHVYGYLVLQSNSKNKAWGTIDKNNLMIITNIIAGTMERIRQEKQINFMAYYDTLTGLPNRTLFMDRLNQAVMLAERTSDRIVVVFVDLDAFKHVNDTIGYEGGDELIKEISRQLSESFRKSDTVSRFSGDGFLIMVNNVENTKDVHKIADKVLGIFRKPFNVNNQEIYISASVGISVYPYDGKDANTLVRNADIAMNEVKTKGKGQYCLCTEDMKEEIILKHELSNRLYRAIDNNELVLYYQPLVSAKTGEILCLEALLRWNQPDYGFVSPGVFIPLAEQNGLIGPIGEWVLKTACSQTKAWLDLGLPPIHISVNVSVLQLRSSKFVSTVRNILNETGLKPEYLDLEITESAAVKEFDNILSILEELRELGVEISIDDFGTEYSSLSRLNHMPVNRIKIDMSFINNLFRSEKDQLLVKSMIHLSQTLGIKVVAEGVEQEVQFEFLREHGCDEIQGYFISRPVHADEVLRFFKKGENLKGYGSVS